MNDESIAHHAILSFGQHKGERLTRIPQSYLQWGVSSGATAAVRLLDGTIAPFNQMAKLELARRGERIPDVEISSHAIDRISCRCLSRWKKTRLNSEEGLYTWAQRMTMEALDAYIARDADGYNDDDETIIITYNDIRWVIAKTYAIPVLKTVKM